jgi:L-alanine-DL-glutamate epimerase-like enolase superfamily enzyme
MRDLNIVAVESLTFRYTSCVGRDEEGHAHPAPPHEAQQTMIAVRTGGGVDGYCFGGTPETAEIANRMLVGMNALDRELIWRKLRQAQRLERTALHDRSLSAIDQALWDIAGQATGLPISKLIGGFREKVPAYASSMCGDDIPGGLGSPEDYADFAQACKEQGYTAFKLHTWSPPYGPDVNRDIAACRAVRERVGPEMRLMLDPYHDYSREEALYLGRALEELDYYWMEEPMNEYSTSSYVWLTNHLDLTIVGPETADGQMFTRAEWIVRGAADVSRVGLGDVGGITPTLKTIHLCESFGMRVEMHGGGAGTLQVMGAMAIPGEYYERGLLHPMVDYDARTPWLQEVIDPVDKDGNVPISQKPGLGHEIDWDFIRSQTVRPWSA